MKKRKRVIAVEFPEADSFTRDEARKTFLILRKRDEERARRAERKRFTAETAPAPVRKPGRKVKHAADTSE